MAKNKNTPADLRPRDGKHGDPTTPKQGDERAAPAPVRPHAAERQEPKGGPAGANQGGAPRGASRLEPSHQHDAAKKDQSKKAKNPD